MSKFLGYRCSLCGSEYGPDEVTYTCPKEGGNLDVVLDYEALARKYQPDDLASRDDNSFWRYQAILPVNPISGGERTPLGVAGGTPVYSLPRLAARHGLSNLWLKDESRNPTASFKDRASAIVVARARELSAEVIVTASTGNAGAALAGMAAAVGQKAVILAPKTAPQAKIAQLLIFGARVLLVDGNYDAAFDLSIQAADAFGWYCRNTGYNPFTAEGKKTAAFEIWDWYRGMQANWAAVKMGRRSSRSEAMPRSPARGEAPWLTIFIPVGDGNIISGIHKGFKDLQALGWLNTLPRLIGVQADGSAAIANAFHLSSEKIDSVSANTIADSISVDLPRDGIRAVRAARETGGTYITISDEAILMGIAELGKMGVFAEPAAAAAYAGFVKAASTGLIGAEEDVLILSTGSGLKDVRAAIQSVAPAPVIEPTLKALTGAL